MMNHAIVVRSTGIKDAFEANVWCFKGEARLLYGLFPRFWSARRLVLSAVAAVYRR